MEYHKKKWELQAKDRQDRKRRRIDFNDVPTGAMTSTRNSLGGFLRRTARSIMDMPWQIVQVYNSYFEYETVLNLNNYCCLLCILLIGVKCDSLVSERLLLPAVYIAYWCKM